MADISPEQMARIEEEAAAQTDPFRDKGKPAPGEKRSTIIQGYVVTYKANQTGQWEVDNETPPYQWLPGQAPREGAPAVIHGNQGSMMWDPDKKDWYLIKGTEPEPKPPRYERIGDTLYEIPQDGGTPRPVATDQGAIGERQAQADARAEIEQTGEHLR